MNEFNVKPQFNVRYKEHDDNGVIIRFYSENQVDLKLHSVKFFNDFDKYEELICPLHITFDNMSAEGGWKEITFPYPPVKSGDSSPKYRSLSFVIKDCIHREQFSINVSFDCGDLKIRGMFYEELPQK